MERDVKKLLITNFTESLKTVTSVFDFGSDLAKTNNRYFVVTAYYFPIFKGQEYRVGDTIFKFSLIEDVSENYISLYSKNKNGDLDDLYIIKNLTNSEFNDLTKLLNEKRETLTFELLNSPLNK